ncbi:MAG: hypothetical protein MJ211_12765 [Bacteroidales bacterium]|nr:hypothetical protein [Bacteroidales bacterium]
MKNIFISLVFIFAFNYAYSQYDDVVEFGETPDEDIMDFLGFSLVPSANLLESFVEVHINPDGSLKYRQLTMDGFVNRASGRERSDANPKSHNFFNEFGIKDPSIVGDLWKLRYKKDPLRRIYEDNSWSRYQVQSDTNYIESFSYNTKKEKDNEDNINSNSHNIDEDNPDEGFIDGGTIQELVATSRDGWAGNQFKPTDAQMQILKKYGIHSLGDFCYGMFAFMLLRDMENGEWVIKYKDAGAVGDDAQVNPNE